jgi:UTP--glucose-1-phosphate uridylyltransferase
MRDLSPALRDDMRAKGIDADLTLSILKDFNDGLYDGVEPVRATGVPPIDGRDVLSLSGDRTTALAVGAREARDRLGELGLEVPARIEEPSPGRLAFGREALEAIGLRLLGRTAFGVLNGGSATSYADSKKNRALGDAVFESLEPRYDELAPLCKDRPKGLTPAYLEPDGRPGASFLLLKMRARLVAALAAKERGERVDGAFMPLFQMTSVGNDAEVAAAYEEYRSHPFLAELSQAVGIDGAAWSTGVQPMIAAFTHSAEGRPKRIFDRARGVPDSALALPGGHGQCFRVLAPVLRSLRAAGARFAYIGNVDNLGYLPDPVEIAALALSGRPAAFDFSLRTPVDVKGGILVERESGGASSRTIADIGPAISFAEVERLESEGNPILFNCATGLFDLDWLVPRIDEVARELPVRFTDQDKDAGRYSQAEQVTWEVAGILPSFLSFAVDKYDRFIAAKLLVETLLTSGAAPEGSLPASLAETSRRLNEGLVAKLSGPCALVLDGGRWVPRESL